MHIVFGAWHFYFPFQIFDLVEMSIIHKKI